MQDLIGRTLGHYRIVEKIGEGGMGEVYRAHDERLDRDVAIKVLPEAVAQDADRLARFEREARAVAKLNHPNILDVYELGEHEGRPFMATELLEGESLRELISEGGVTTGKAVEYARAIADGLAAAHDKGIIHRDLKPENVFLTTDGRIKILDFGLAKLKLPETDLTTETPTATLDTAAGGLIGTVPYMAPEQVQGQPADHRSDIFALGVVLYEMLTGHRPFGGSTTVETAAAILKEDPEPISVAVSAVSPALGSVVSKCLEKRPEDRFSAAHDLALTLCAVDSVVWPPSTQDQSLIGKRWPHILAVVIAAVIALFFVFPPEGLFERLAEQPAEAAPPRIVVLPFENLGSPNDEYFADGITEEITSRLAAVSGLQVISRTSAMQYKERRPPLQQIGEELDVGYVLEGTIRWDRSREGHGRVRITPQLINVADDTHLWSERYDRVLEDIFKVQSDIAEQVISHLQVTLLEPERSALEARPTENLEAYRAYLSGMNIGSTEQEEDLELAVDMFERAIELDPQFALAYAGLAEASSLMIHYRIDLSSKRLEEAADAAERAVELGPDLPETHRARGRFFYLARRDYDNALDELRYAASKRPGDSLTLRSLAAVERRQNDWLSSLEILEKAIRLDPLNWILPFNQGITYMFLREYERAAGHLKKSISITPDRLQTYYWLADTYRLWDGSPERARSVLESMPSESHELTVYAWLKQHLYERDYESALRLVRRASEKTIRVRDQLLPPTMVACECLFALHRPNEARRACNDAIAALESDEDNRREDPRLHSALGKGHALLGNKEEAIRHARQAVELWPIQKDAVDGCSFEVYLAEIYSLTGEAELAIERLEYLLSIPSTVSIASLRYNPAWDPLRDHPRFQALLEKYDTN